MQARPTSMGAHAAGQVRADRACGDHGARRVVGGVDCASHRGKGRVRFFSRSSLWVQLGAKPLQGGNRRVNVDSAASRMSQGKGSPPAGQRISVER